MNSKGSFGKRVDLLQDYWTDFIVLDFVGFFTYWIQIAFKGPNWYFQEIELALTVNDTKMLRLASVCKYFAA